MNNRISDFTLSLNYVNSQFEKKDKISNVSGYDMFKHHIVLHFNNSEKTNWLSVTNAQLEQIKQILIKG